MGEVLVQGRGPWLAEAARELPRLPGATGQRGGRTGGQHVSARVRSAPPRRAAHAAPLLLLHLGRLRRLLPHLPRLPAPHQVPHQLPRGQLQVQMAR